MGTPGCQAAWQAGCRLAQPRGLCRLRQVPLAEPAVVTHGGAGAVGSGRRAGPVGFHSLTHPGADRAQPLGSCTCSITISTGLCFFHSSLTFRSPPPLRGRLGAGRMWGLRRDLCRLGLLLRGLYRTLFPGFCHKINSCFTIGYRFQVSTS